MDNVQFEEAAAAHQAVQAPKGIMGLVIKYGLAKDAQGAQMVLLIATVVAIGIAFTAPFILGSKGDDLPVKRQEINSALPPGVLQ